jgi:HEAT repeat protein
LIVEQSPLFAHNRFNSLIASLRKYVMRYPFILLFAFFPTEFVVGQDADELIKQMKSSDAITRRIAAEAAGKQKIELAIPALGELINDKEDNVNSAAMDALVRIGAKSTPTLGKALNTEQVKTRLAVLEALIHLGSDAKEALEPIQKCLVDKDKDVRIHSALALKKIGPGAKEALPALFEAAKDTANFGEVIRAFKPGSVCEAAVDAVLTIDVKSKEELAKAILPTLIEQLKSKDNAILQAVGGTLGKLGTYAKPALPAMKEAANRAKGFASTNIQSAILSVTGEDPRHKLILDEKAPLEQRLKAIGDFVWSLDKDVRLHAIFMKVAKDKEPKMRAQAVFAIGNYKVKEAVPILIELLGDDELEKAGFELQRKDVLSYAMKYVAAIFVRMVGRPEFGSGGDSRTSGV